jgi:hypothetical protein
VAAPSDEAHLLPWWQWPAKTEPVTRRHRQLNDLRQIHPFRSIGSGARGAGHLAPDSEGLRSRRAMISGIGSCRTAEEVCNLVVNREEALGHRQLKQGRAL